MIDSGGEVAGPWQTREQWAKSQRDTAGWSNPNHVTLELVSYGSAVEIDAAIASVKAIRLDVQRLNRAAHVSLGTLGRKRGESELAYWKRVMRMPDDDRQVICNALHDEPAELRDVLSDLKCHQVPWREVGDWFPSALRLLYDRYKAAQQASDAAWEAEVEARPIDDDAWQRELERRRKLQTKYPHWYVGDVNGSA